MNAPARKPVCHILHFADGGRLLIMAIRKPRPSRLLLRLVRRAHSWIAASIGVLASMFFAGAQAQVAPTALPTDGRVVSGQAAVSQAGARMDVRQSSTKAILNWGSFNIGSQAQVNFAQPASTAVALNRVLSGDPSQIYGKLSANGQVFLLNPNGVLFGPSARVDVGGIVASTLSIKDSDFLAGNYRFTRDGATGTIVNQGTLTAAEGGYVALLSPEVCNQGVIQATLGTVALAGGDALTLKFNADAPLSVAVDPATVETLIENKNLVRADGGTVIMSAKAADELAGAVIQAGGIIAADSLQSRNGQIVLDAGSNGAIELVGVLSAQGKTPNSAGGRIEATGNTIHLLNADIDASGVTQGGTVRLGAGGQNASHVLVDAGSTIRANGDSGGQVELQAAMGETDVLGTVQVRGIGSEGRGGSIRVLGDRVAVYGNASIDASGAAGGGEIVVGGDYQGKNPAVPNARASYVGRDATLSANALARGDGGRIIVWSDEATRVYGTLEAKGGEAAGNGGFVETSGKFLDAVGARVDASARAGVAGQWLLDPFNITIVPAGSVATSGVSNSPIFTSNALSATLTDADINAALNSGTSVTIQTGSAGAEPGNVSFESRAIGGTALVGIVPAYVHKTAGGDATLRVNAHNDIYMASDTRIESSAGRLNVEFNSDSDGVGGGGMSMGYGSSITSNGGNIVFMGGGPTGRAIGSSAGIYINTGRLIAGSGTIDLRGSGTASAGDGVLIENSILQGDTIRIDGFAPTTSPQAYGVHVADGSRLDGRDILIDGRTNSVAPNTPKGKWWSTLVSDDSVVHASANGRILVQGSDGYVGTLGGALVEAEGSSPITFAGRWIDLVTGDIGNAGYAGDITFVGERVNLERRSAASGPMITTSGRVIIRPNAPGDLEVFLHNPIFSSSITDIRIGDSNTRNLAFPNSDGDTSDGPISVPSPVVLQASGTTSFESDTGIQSTASGTAITVVTGVFNNMAGSSALSAPNGRWLVYADDPRTSNEGFSSYNKHYNQTYTPGSGPPYAASGNWFLYSVAPTLSVTPGSQSITYGDATPTVFIPIYSGFIDGDNDGTAGLSGTASWAVAGPVSTSGHLTAGPHDVSYTGGLASSLGYLLVDDGANPPVLAVTAKPLTAGYNASNKVYDGTTAATVVGSSADIIAGDVVGFRQNAAFIDKNVGVAKTVSVTDIALLGADAANYLLLNPSAITTAGIVARALTITANDDRVRYSGRPYSGGNGVTYASFVSGEDSQVLSGTLVYGGTAQGAVLPATYTISPSGLTAANYVISYVDGTLLLEPQDSVPDPPPPPGPISIDPISRLDTYDPVEPYFPSLPGTGDSPVPGPGGESEGSGEGDATAGEGSEVGDRLAALAYVQAARHQARTELYKDALDAIREDSTIADVPECDEEKSKERDREEVCIPKVAAADKEPASAQSPSEAKAGLSAQEPEQKVALLIGNNAYKGRIRRLDTPIRDMTAISKVLRSSMGYEVKVVENATKRDMIEELVALSQRVARDDSVLVMYAGHGYEMNDTKQGFWLPVDASPSDAKSWVSNNDIYKLLKVIPAKQIILISDSCFSGTLTKEQKLGAIGTKKDILGRRSVVAMSSGDETPVADVGLEKHSIFAYHLIKQLGGTISDQVASQLLDTMRAEVRKFYPQVPQIGGVISAGHVVGGDYLFLPKDEPARASQ